MEMKRLIITGVIVGLVLLVVIINVFNTSTMVCKSISDQSKSGYTIETRYIIESRGKIVKKIKITEIIKSKDEKKLKDFEKQFEKQYSYNKKTYGGYDYKVTNKNGKVTTNIKIDYRHFDMKKFAKDNGAMKEFIVDDKLTLSGAKKLYESTGARCKE